MFEKFKEEIIEEATNMNKALLLEQYKVLQDGQQQISDFLELIREPRRIIQEEKQKAETFLISYKQQLEALKKEAEELLVNFNPKTELENWHERVSNVIAGIKQEVEDLQTDINSKNHKRDNNEEEIIP